MKTIITLLSLCLFTASATTGTASPQVSPATWVGTNFNNAYWSIPSNWKFGRVPDENDEVVFPHSVFTAKVTINDLINLKINTILIQDDYTIRGNSIAIGGGGNLGGGFSGDILVTGLESTDEISASIECGLSITVFSSILVIAPDSGLLGTSESSLYLKGPIELIGSLSLLANNPFFGDDDGFSRIYVSGKIYGSGRILAKAAPGSWVEFIGTHENTFTGDLLVSASSADGYYYSGNIYFTHDAGSAVGAKLSVLNRGKAVFLRDNQIKDSATVTIESGGRLLFRGHDDAFANLEMKETAFLDTEGGTCSLTGSLTSDGTNATSRIDGFLSLESSLPFRISGGLDINANISGVGFTKYNSGTLRLLGNNTFGGPVTIAEGTVEAWTPVAFGANSEGTTLDGGAISLHQVAISREPLTVSVRSSLFYSNASSWSGPVVLNADLDVEVVPLSSDAFMSFTGPISGPGGLDILVGRVRLSGPSANSFTGTTRMNSFSFLLELAKPSDVRALSGPLVIGGPRVPGSGTQIREVRWLNHRQLPSSANVTVYANGLVSLAGFTEVIDQLTFNGGHVNLGAGSALTLTGDVVANHTTALIDGATNQGGLFLAGQRTFTVGDSAGLHIDSQISGAGLNKAGPGTLLLRGNNVFANQTVISDGILIADHNKALGSTSSGTTVNDGATLWLGANVITMAEPLTLNGAGFDGPDCALAAVGVTTATANVVLQSPSTIRTEGSATFNVAGVISGTGPLTKTGSGLLLMAGSSENTYTGDTLVKEGYLFLNKSTDVVCIPGHLVIGSGAAGSSANVTHLTGSFTVNGSITVNRNGLYNLGGASESFSIPELGGRPPLTLNDGGDVQTANGRLILPADTTVVVEPGFNGSSSISGRLALEASMAFGGNHIFAVNSPISAFAGVPLTISAALEAVSSTAHVIKTGPGEMRLSGNNTYTGQLAVNGGRVSLGSSGAIGASGGGVLISSNAALAIDGSFTYNNETLTLNSTAPVPLSVLSGASVWNSVAALNLTRNSTIAVNTNSSLEVYGAISGPGALTKTGPGLLYLKGSTANTYTNTTTVLEGTLVLNNTVPNQAIVGPLIIGDGLGGAEADVVRLDRVRQIANTVPVTIHSSGLLSILSGKSDAFGSLTGSGNIVFEGTGDLEVGLDDGSSTFSGVISGGGNFWKRGVGRMTLSGNNTYPGTTFVDGGGTLLVNGSQTQSAVSISEGATLGGSGIVGSITVASGGTVSPGASAGILSCSFIAFSAPSIFRVELNGTTAGSGYDQLAVRSGGVQLGGATLNVTLGFQAASNDTFRIINKASVGAVSGTFSGLPENATLNISGIQFRISYAGGNGNDVVLTQLQSLPSLSSLRVSNTNLALSWPTQNASFTLESNTNLNFNLWNLVSPSPVINGTRYTVTNIMIGPQKFFRLRSP